METSFDFEQVGKRMPYSVPDGFFDQLEREVMGKLNASSQPSPGKGAPILSPLLGRRWGRLLFAAAAVAVLCFVLKATLPKRAADDFQSVELAFNSLSQADQDYLLSFYEQDIFINEMEEEE